MDKRLFCVFFGVAALLLFGLVSTGFASDSGSFTDSRNGRVYRTVRIGTQTWMAENLNYKASGSVCYNNSTSNCDLYGRLYDWNTALTACPAGWRLPTDDDWDNLVQAAGGGDVVGTKLKSRTGWEDGGDGLIPGTDDFGFSALPGGYGWSGGFSTAGYFGYWWSATELDDATNARGRIMNYNFSYVDTYWGFKAGQFSVRCLRDNAAP
jgi:uncharacterized protein (TIGR02145 family)